MASFNGYLNCGKNECKCCDIFTVVYTSPYKGLESDSYRFYKEHGKVIANKIANAKPSCYNAHVA